MPDDTTKLSGGTNQSGRGSDSLKAHCFNPRCETTFDSVNDMVPVPGRGNRSPRHFCEPCSERVRRGPPLTDGGEPNRDSETVTGEIVAEKQASDEIDAAFAFAEMAEEAPRDAGNYVLVKVDDDD